MKKIIYCCVLLLSSLTTFPQSGHYFLSHHAPSSENIDHFAFDILQDNRGIMHFATRSGILQYDGVNWTVVPATGAVYALEKDKEGTVYWAGVNGFGMLKASDDGAPAAKTLSDISVKDVYQALTIKSQTYFLNDDAIYIYTSGESVSKIVSDDKQLTLTKLFELFGLPYAASDNGKIYKIGNNGLAPSSLNIPLTAEIIFTSKHGNKYLIATADSRLFICNDQFVFREIALYENEYIQESVIMDGTWINQQLVALGTLRGGVIFINPVTGRIVETINYNTGLPDNEVFALMQDEGNNIWVAHDYGFSRIEPFLPLRSFSHYEGLQGNLLCAISHRDTVYVGTSLGLFVLTKEDVYDENVYYVEVQRRVMEETEIEEIDPPHPVDEEINVQTPTADHQPKKKNGLFRFLKRNRDKAEQQAALPAEEPAKSSLTAKPVIKKKKSVDYKIVTDRVARTEKVLRSSRLIFNRIQGIESKVTHLSVLDGHLIASGLSGVFEVQRNKAVPLAEEPIRFTYPHASGLLFVSTYSDNLYTYKKRNDKWEKAEVLKSLDDQITFIFGGQGDEVWMCGLEKVYRLELMKDRIFEFASFDMNNAGFTRTVGASDENKTVFVNGEGFYRFDKGLQKIVSIDSLQKTKTYFSSGKNLWYRNEQSWKVIGPASTERNIRIINLCPDLRLIAENDDSDNLLLITAENNLYRFFADKFVLHDERHPLFLKSVLHNGEGIATNKKIKVNQDEGTLNFEVIQPSFTGVDGMQYRYFVQGLHDKWSEWSAANNRMSFPYLPAGSYELLVESKDLFGTIGTMPPVAFSILPPYWKRPWFYAMEFTIFALLVMLSFRLSTRYRFVSRLLSLLTIILLIEFIQTIAGYSFTTDSSPVVDFLIQVLIACLILPVEGFLRNVMFRSMGSGSRLYEVIKEMEKNEKAIK